MQMALDDAKLDASDIDYLNAHGTATTPTTQHQRDPRDQERAQGSRLQDRDLARPSPCTAIRSGAGGGIEAVACIKAMEESWVPPTIGLDEPGPECDLDYIPNVGRDLKVNYAMSNSFAFGGLNAVLVFGQPS